MPLDALGLALAAAALHAGWNLLLARERAIAGCQPGLTENDQRLSVIRLVR